MMAGQSKRVYLFNCDKTYDLKIVEEFLLEVAEKHGFQIVVEPLYFGLQRMAEMCEKTIPTLQMDLAIFVVHANESRLSINEDNAGIGYAKFYRKLLQKTENKVLIVIGGDSYYKDQGEEQRSVISRWAKRKVASQFREEYLDGRESFIFSWDQKHRPIHEEALRHYLDPAKRGCKFEYIPPKPLPKPNEPEVILPANDQAHEPFVVDDDTRALLQDEGETTGSLHRSSSASSDREAQKQELKSNVKEPASYGATCQGASGTPHVYPGETVLLETRMHNGRISYKDEDVTKWTDRWQPTDKQVSDLMEDWKSLPVSKVKFISTGNGIEANPVVSVSTTPGFWKRRRGQSRGVKADPVVSVSTTPGFWKRRRGQSRGVEADPVVSVSTTPGFWKRRWECCCACCRSCWKRFWECCCACCRSCWKRCWECCCACCRPCGYSRCMVKPD